MISLGSSVAGCAGPGSEDKIWMAIGGCGWVGGSSVDSLVPDWSVREEGVENGAEPAASHSIRAAAGGGSGSSSTASCSFMAAETPGVGTSAVLHMVARGEVAAVAAAAAAAAAVDGPGVLGLPPP